MTQKEISTVDEDDILDDHICLIFFSWNFNSFQFLIV